MGGSTLITQENSNIGMLPTVPGVIKPQYVAPSCPENMMPKMGSMAYQVVYPEVFYKLQPYIMMVCDQMDTYGSAMPTRETVEYLTDCIYDDVCRMHPDMVEYVRENSQNAGLEAETMAPIFDRDRDFRRRFRRRGIFRDLIDILLLSEFSRRRRRY